MMHMYLSVAIVGYWGYETKSQQTAAAAADRNNKPVIFNIYRLHQWNKQQTSR